MLEKIKRYWEAVMGVLLAVLTGAFLYERSRRQSAEAIADNKEMLDKLNKGDKELSANEGKLELEETKREEIRKGTEDAKSDDSDNSTDFLKRR